MAEAKTVDQTRRVDVEDYLSLDDLRILRWLGDGIHGSDDALRQAVLRRLDDLIEAITGRG